MDERRTGKAPDMADDAKVALPELIAVVVVAMQTRRPMPYDDMLAIGGG